MKFSPCDFLSEKQCKNPIDKLHLKFLKHILGVNQRATNWAVLSETNRNSLITKVIDKMIGYWIRIKNSPSSIVQDVLELSKQLHRKGKTSWFTSITKIAETTGNTNEFGDYIKTENKSKIQKILDKMWYLKRIEYSQGKRRLYTNLKVRPGFEQYLNLSNPKLKQSITKLRISAHKFPIKIGRFENKSPAERICPLCCEGTGDVCHYFTQCNNEEIKKVRHELMMPFYQNWKGIEKLSNEELCSAILSCQNEDLLVEIGMLYLKIKETFEAVAL